MSRARELAKAGGKNQQVIAGLSSHVGVSTFAADVFMYSDLQVTGTTTFNGGTLTLGDSASDNVVFGADVDSSIIPDDDNTYDLGSSTQEWRNIYIDGTANIDALLADTAKIGDLTNDRVVISGTSGELEDSANLTFNGTILTTTNVVVTGDTDLGNATSDTITVTGRFDSDLVPSTDNARDLGASGLEFKDLYLDGTANIDSLVADTAKVSDLTSGRVVLAGTSGEIEDSGNLTFNGSKLTVTGNAQITSDLDVDGGANISGGESILSSATVSDLTNNRVVIAGTSGAIEDDGNLTFDGAKLAIGVALDVDGHTDLDNLGVSGVGTITQLVSTTATVGAALTVTGVIDGNGGANISGAETVLSSATVSDLTNNRVVIAGTSGAIEDSANLTFDGSTLAVTGSQTVSSDLTVTGNIVANGNVDLGNATGDTITATGRFDSDIVPSTDNARDLGASGLEFKDLYLDGTANIDSLVADTADINGGSIDGATIGAASPSSIVATTITANSNVTITGSLDANGGASIDNIQIGVTGDNEIDTASGNLTIDSAGGTVTVDDNLTVSGDLTVNGTTTTINSTTVAIDDKNFQVATGAADDAAADGAGLTVDSGDGDKTWNFEATGDNWGASENINLASGKVLKVNNTQILSATALSSAVVVDLASVNIDGGTDIGADIVDADEMLIDDGGGGTNRRSDMSRVKKYIWSSASSDLTASDSGVVTLANSGVSAGTVGSATAIPIITVDSKGRITNTSTTAVDSTTIAVLDTSVAVTDTGSNGKITGKADNTTVYEGTAGQFAVTGNITVTGTVDGRDVAGDGSKLDGIESAATQDQTASEILTLIKTVDGAGSGLDADTLDGISSASFLRSDTSDTFTGTLTMAGSIIPSANGTQNLGSSGTRWANVYSSDIDLNNEWKGGNTIDQSWGSYLIEEGEHDLFLKNRRNGKSYRFVLEEV